ncbi:MAG: hypothetical protein JWM80_389 [Cyanobacteria bacterium RYN_339]|nr:hypothetical protein [Cyanobacteria bacterium RYN_339]
MTNRLLVATLALVLAGCGTQARLATPAAPTAVKAQAKQRFFPTNQATVWQYDVVSHPTDDPDVDYKGTETVTVDAVRTKGDATVLQLRAIDTYTNYYRFPVVTEDAQGVSIAGVTFYGAGAEAADGLNIQFLKFPLALNARWDDGQWIGKALKHEQVHVPAGTYDAWVIDCIGTYDQAYTAVGKYWVAPGAGIVKSELSVPGFTMESVLIPAGRKK